MLLVRSTAVSLTQIIPVAVCAGLVAALFASAASAQSRVDPAHALAERFSGSGQESRSAAEDRRLKEEQEMLERARQEAIARAEADAEARREADVKRHAMEAERAAEAQRLADKLRRAEDARRERAAAATAADEPGDPQGGELGVSPAQGSAAIGLARDPGQISSDPRVTILLLMEPGDRGIRRFNKTADPVLCQGQRCFISQGPGAPAKMLSRSRTLGSANTLGRRADACNQRLECVFRAVDLSGASPMIQPIDMKILQHDRRTPRSVSSDTSCALQGGMLFCGRTVVAPGYRAWIVPEAIADLAGPDLLNAALARGLQQDQPREASFRGER